MAKPQSASELPDNYSYHESSEEVRDNIASMYGPGSGNVREAIENDEDVAVDEVEDQTEDTEEEPGRSTLDEMFERDVSSENEDEDEDEDAEAEEDSEDEEAEDEDSDDTDGEEELDAASEDVESSEADIEASDEADNTQSSADVDAALLRLQNEQLEHQIEQFKKEKEKEKEEAEQASKTAAFEYDYENLPAYGFQVPDALMEYIVNEDAGAVKMGLEHLLNTTLGAAHQRIAHEVKQLVDRTVRATVPQLIQQQEAQKVTNEAIRNDFFKHYPAFKDERFSTYIQQAIAVLEEKLSPEGWTAEFRDAVGSRVEIVTGIKGKAVRARSSAKKGKARRKGSAKKKGKSRRKAPKALSSGSRPSTATKEELNPVAKNSREMWGSDPFARR
jgi:hypothetical protein